jgi:hypothetical protein
MRATQLEGFEHKPPALRHYELLAVSPHGQPSLGWGIAHNQRADEYSIAVPCHGSSFALLDTEEQAARQTAYADLLATFGLRPQAGIVRMWWVERVIPDGGEGVIRQMNARFEEQPRGSWLQRAQDNYRQLVADSIPISQQHQVLFGLVLSGAAARARSRNKEEAAARMLLDEAGRLREMLEAADIRTDNPLSPREWAAEIRSAFRPDLRSTRALMERHGAEKGIPISNAWPAYVETSASWIAVDGFYHRVYAVREWPRTDVGPDFLAPLLRETTVSRAVAVAMEPVPVQRSQSRWKHQEVKLRGARDDRDRLKQIHTPQHQADEAAHLELGQQIAEGHIQVRYRGFVAVTARSLEDLELECGEVETSASQSRLELETMTWQQAEGLVNCLPLGAGL